MLRWVLFVLGVLMIFTAVNGQDTRRGMLVYDDMEREFDVFLPSIYRDDGDPLPMVMVFHGAGGSATSMAQLTGFNDIAEREGFIVVYPVGPLGYWDYGAGTTEWENVPDVRDDPGFLAFLLPALQDTLNIDPDRIYATGYSNGARMAFRLGCDLSDRIVAIAAVSATISDEVTDNCPEDGRVSVLYMHGTGDTVTPWEGKPLFIEGRRISTALSAPDTVTFWATQNGCDPATVTQIDATRDNLIGITHYTDCDDGREVRFHPVHNGSHSWFRLDGAEFDASEVIWEFFSNNARLSVEDTPTENDDN